MVNLDLDEPLRKNFSIDGDHNATTGPSGDLGDRETPKFYYTVFPDQLALDKELYHVTLDELAQHIRGEIAASKADLPFCKLAIFGEQKTPKGCYRSDSNVQTITGVEADYDGGVVTFSEAVAKLRQARVKGLIYTTPSNTDAKARWRVICPTAAHHTPRERRALVDRLNGVIGGGLASESWTLSQSYYFGNVEGRPPVQVEVVQGIEIDQRLDVDSIPKPAKETLREHPDAEPVPGKPMSLERFNEAGAAAAIACQDLHYPELLTVILGALRIPVHGDEDGLIRTEVARAIWDANGVSESRTDEKFDDILSRANDHRYGEDGKVVGPGTFVHYAKLGGWEPRPSHDETYGAFIGHTGQGNAKAKAIDDDDERLTAKFMLPENTDAPLFKTTTLGDYLYAEQPSPERRDLVPDWVAADRFIPLCGPGGYHKSRLLQQLAFCKLYDRELFMQKADPNSPVRGARRAGECGGIPVGRIELLSYEDPEAAMHRRVEAMKAAFVIPETRDGRADRFARHEVTMPVLIVGDNGDPRLTPLGCAMLRRWEALAEAGEHLVLWFDSFFDAVSFSQKARIDDAIARRAIRLLDHWCKLLDATILAPFHPSRSGQDHGHTGYAPAFENSPRQVLRIGAKREKVRGGGQYEFRETGEYVFLVHKWNDGQMGKRINFWFADGQLVSTANMTETAETAAAAAVAIITSRTYGAKAAKFGIGITPSEQEEIERSCPWRVRRNGKAWVAGPGDAAIGLTTEHFIMDEYRQRVGNPKSQVRDFLNACDAAVRAGDMGYRDRDETVRANKRLPTGYYVVFPESQESFGEPDLALTQW